MEIPAHVLDSVSCLLRPYGVDFSKLLQSGGYTPHKYMTAKQASVYCGLSPKTIRDKALSGEFCSIKIGDSDKSRVLIKKSDLDNWLERFSSREKQKMA
ncbi:MAG: helix-turn-helix domain-containing protein [Oscillospiraceae bacterium]|nr:helix-turn-helix domain-containing protein [Oscillospiraceae bacterium]